LNVLNIHKFLPKMIEKMNALIRAAVVGIALFMPVAKLAAFTPLSLTGFNADLIAQGPGAATGSVSIAGGFGGSGYAFVAQDYGGGSSSPSYFFPDGGELSSVLTPGLTFQLAGYAANNVLHITAVNAAETLTVTTPSSAGDVYLLGAGAGGDVTVTVEILFTDNTTETFANVEFADWSGTAAPGVPGVGRVNLTDNNPEGDFMTPSLFERKLSLNSTNHNKLISMIIIAKTGGAGALGIVAATTTGVCSGTPSGGIAQSSEDSTCNNTTLVISASGHTVASTISYQWEASINGGTSYDPVTGETATTYMVSNQAVTTLYRLKVTCGASGLEAFSTPVTVVQKGPTECYCETYNGSCTNDHISNVVTTGGTANITNATGCSGGFGAHNVFLEHGYANIQGATVNFSVTTTSREEAFKVWVDFNRNGDFSDAGEEVYASALSASGTNTVAGSFQIPLNAPAGDTRMRIRCKYNDTAIDPCDFHFTGGETEDYKFTVVAIPLPVTLESFTAVNDGDKNRIQWKVRQETGISGYEVERSYDGHSFSPISFQPAYNRPDAYIYKLDDNSYTGSKIYYRLRIAGIDGNSRYSQVCRVETRLVKSSRLSIYPQPATGQLHLTFTAPSIGGEAHLIDVNGKLLLKQVIAAGVQQEIIDLAGISPGIYYLKYRASDGSSNTYKVIKQ
jgi:hypothetical protein